MRTLVEMRVLVGDRGVYRLATPVEATQVPATVQAVLAARIDRLPAAVERLLQSAAVIGKDVALSLLEAVADQPTDDVAVVSRSCRPPSSSTRPVSSPSSNTRSSMP